MKRSIRTTFIGLFIGLLAMVLLAVWAMNSFFLENYYLNDKVKILQDTYTQINAYATVSYTHLTLPTICSV